MGLISQYHHSIEKILQEIEENEEKHIQQAATLLAEKVVQGRLINIFGAGGHSAIAGMEVFYRAGGLVPVNPIFPPGMNVLESRPTMSRLAGTGEFILNYYQVEADDILIVVNFYGLNPASIDTALAAKKRGTKLITINSHLFASQIPKNFRWRHPTKLNLNELADVAIDNHVPKPDAVLRVPGIENPLSASATIATCFTLNALMAETAVAIKRLGKEPEIWLSNNIPGGDEHNDEYIKKYRSRIHFLYPVS
ncbi:MAG TPA: sugar isomerase domain-containing protein [Phycisphaerae bacterium]|nr:sugar isomerase domain-containing protein [Phycisphaerae bacterium]